jgi:hypothetical protein
VIQVCRLLLVLVAGVVAGNLSVTDEEPIPLLPGSGGAPWSGAREVLWINNPDFASDGSSSEVIDEYDLETETADDFLFEADAIIQKVTWWGVYYHYEPGDLDLGFNLRFYRDNAGLPEAEPFVEYIIEGDANETLADGGDMFSQFVYWHCICLALPAGRYWFSAQCEHIFPPQWFRMGADTIQLCESAFRSTYFSYPDWVPVGVVFGSSFDVSQMFEDECEATAIDDTRWGAVKALYRRR